MKFNKISFYFIPVGVILIDQTIKTLLIKNNFPYILNPDFIFCLGKNWDLFFWICCTMIVLLFLLSFRRNLTETLSLFIILGSAVTNLLDRIFRGGVIDYWQINYFGRGIYFNLADLLLILGVMIYAWQIRKENQN